MKKQKLRPEFLLFFCLSAEGRSILSLSGILFNIFM